MNFEDYKKIDALNYSLLKTVADRGHLYQVERKVKETKALDLGTVVDDLALPTKDAKQYYFTTHKDPTATSLKLAWLLVDYCLENDLSVDKLKELDEKKDIILNLIKDEKLWPNIKQEHLLIEKYNDENFYKFLKAKLEAKKGKILVSQDQWQKANELVDILQNHPYTKEIFNKGDNQFVYIFTIGSFKYKVKLDKLIIDHTNKIIKPFDLKTGEASAQKFVVNFYKYRYYLQQALYILAVQHYAKYNYPDYKVDDFKFIYISTIESNPYPVIYTMNEDWAELGWIGFNVGNKKYKGIKGLTEEYQYYQEYGTDLPMEVRLNEGKMDIPLPI